MTSLLDVGAPAPPSAPRGRTAASGLGQALLTVGMVLLLFCAYELWVTGLVTVREQDHLARDLTRSWAQPAPQPAAADDPPAAAPLGSAVARLYLPTLRGSKPLVVVEGVAVPDLKKGPGHLPGSAAPGAVGNTVLSGHRTTYGAPFADLDRLRPGDPVVIETRDTWLTYRVIGSQVVDPSAVEVTLPVPGQPAALPTGSLLTMTTCHPKYSARQRLVVRGELLTSTPVAAGPPTALEY